MTVCDQLLEPLEVELARIDTKEVARSARDEPRLVSRGGRQRLAQAQHVIAERVVGGVHALLGEQLADQTLARDDAIRAQKQQGEQRPLFRPADRDRSPVHPHRERTEDPKLETVRCHGARRSLSHPSGRYQGSRLR